MEDEPTEFANSALGAHSIRNPRVEYKRGGETGAVAGMKVAVKQLHLSARAYHRVLKLARTIADFSGE